MIPSRETCECECQFSTRSWCARKRQQGEFALCWDIYEPTRTSGLTECLANRAIVSWQECSWWNRFWRWMTYR